MIINIFMRFLVHVKLVVADCSVPCRMAFPPQMSI